MKTDLVVFEPLAAEIVKAIAPILLMRVTDPESGQLAIDATKSLRAYEKKVEQVRKSIVEPLNSQVRATNERARQILTPLDRAEAHLKRELAEYETRLEKIRQERLRQAEEAKREAERKAREEQERKLAEIEAERQAALLSAGEESACEIMAAFGEAEPTRTPEEIEAIAREQSMALDARAEQERIERERAHQQAEWDIAQLAVKNARTNWCFEVTDPALVPREFLKVDEQAIRAYVRARKEQAAIPGVRTWSEKSVAIGANTRIPQAALAHGEEES